MSEYMTIHQLDNWLLCLIADARRKREPAWHLWSAKAGMRKKQPRLIEYRREARLTRPQ